MSFYPKRSTKNSFFSKKMFNKPLLYKDYLLRLSLLKRPLHYRYLKVPDFSYLYGFLEIISVEQ